MGYKKLDKQTNFADLILKDSMDKNGCLHQLMDINDSNDWARIESVLMDHYKVGGGGPNVLDSLSGSISSGPPALERRPQAAFLKG